MKTIGLIGGMSWESSKIYYEEINLKVKELLGGSHSAKSIMVSVDFAAIEKFSFEENWQEIGVMMTHAAQQLEKGGADIILLCTNTIHLVSDAIVTATNIPFLHIAEATGEAIQKKGLKKIGLLGTRFTMEKEFYKHLLKDRYQIDTLIPSASERQIVHDIIYKELVLGTFKETSRRKMKNIIENLKKEGAEGVILGCTEIPLLIKDQDVDLPLFDTGKIHAHKAVDWALQD